MDKINWINGQAGGTPLSAENLNQMQDNIEDAINNVSSFMNGTILYESNTGTNSTISLSENPLNFKRLEIDYLTDDGTHTVQYNKENIPIFESSTQTHNLISCYFGASYWYTFEAYISINTDSIVFSTNRTYQQNVNTPSGLNRIEDAPIKILKITGFDY